MSDDQLANTVSSAAKGSKAVKFSTEEIGGPLEAISRTLCAAELESVLENGMLTFPLVTVSLDGERVDRGEFVRDINLPGGAVLREKVDADRVWTQYTKGGTIIFQHAHMYMASIGDAAQQLELALGRSVEAHAFLSPRHALKPALRAHADKLDAIVVQAKGSKRCRAIASRLKQFRSVAA